MENTNNNHQQSFMQFSDQLRVQGTNFANLSINDSIWSTNSFTAKKPEERRNFDIRVGAERSVFKQNGFNNGWKIGSNIGEVVSSVVNKSSDVNGGGSTGYLKSLTNSNTNSNSNSNSNINSNFNSNNYSNTSKINEKVKGKVGKKSNPNNNNNNNNSGGGNSKSSVDKRFKTLPPSESLPRGERIGGYIFVCNNDTMQENLQRQLFGLPPRYRDSVRAITPGLPLFLYNYSNHQLHGIFEASSFGGTNIDPKAWEDKKCLGESRFPAQVKVVTRKICDALEEDSFRPILHHYDGPKFRLELSVPEALALLDVFAES